MNKKLLVTGLPIVLFIVLVIIFWVALGKDPKKLNSTLIDKPLPDFKLPLLFNPEKASTPKDLPQGVFLLNVWGTWCPPCHIEHPYLLKYSEQSPVPIIGVNYKDDSVKAIEFLSQSGNPYEKVFVDEAGSYAIDLGVYGAPETFVVDANGKIRFRYVGVIDDRVWRTKIQPAIDAVSENPETNKLKTP